MEVLVTVSLKCDIHRERYSGGYRYSVECPMFGVQTRGPKKDDAKENMIKTVNSLIKENGFSPANFEKYKDSLTIDKAMVTIGDAVYEISPGGELDIQDDEQNCFWLETTVRCTDLSDVA